MFQMIDFNAAPPQGQTFYKPPTQKLDPLESFQAELTKYKLVVSEIIADGQLHRFDVDKGNDKAGWYIFHYGDICGASFGNWKDGTKVNWCSHESSQSI